MVSLILTTCVERYFQFCDIISILDSRLVFKSSSLSLYSCLCSSEYAESSSDSFDFLLSVFMDLSISVKFEVLFISSPCIDCTFLLIPKTHIYQDHYFVIFPVFWLEYLNLKIKVCGTVSISMSVDNSRLSFVASLKDWSLKGGVSSRIKTLLITFTPPNLSFTEFGATESPVSWLVKDCHFSPLKKCKSVLPVLDFIVVKLICVT